MYPVKRATVKNGPSGTEFARNHNAFRKLGESYNGRFQSGFRLQAKLRHLVCYAVVFWLIGFVFDKNCFSQNGESAVNGIVKLSEDRLTVSVELSAKQTSVVIPNYHAVMHSIKLTGPRNGAAVALAPLVDGWEIKIASPLTEPAFVEIQLGTPAIETIELPTIAATPDGGFRIPASYARVVSKKLRFENLPHKNTVGYWVHVEDYAYFLIDIDAPASWNAGVLQGCGAGQGGSNAQLSLVGPLENIEQFGNDQVELVGDVASRVDFKVEETGHFQNFQWRHVGTLSAELPGIYAVKVSAVEIANKAVMDVREIQLTKLP